jgi:general secretion pathway protein G
MIAARTRTTRHLRPGFTLLEVLVVVAILVILASVASIAVFSFLDDAKVNKAILDMQSFETIYKGIALNNPDQVNSSTFQLEMLVPKITQGSEGLKDPWGNIYQYRFVQSGETGEERIQFFTINPKTSEEIVWPRR